MKAGGGKIGEGDFSEESNWAGQLAAQEERIKRAFQENQAGWSPLIGPDQSRYWALIGGQLAMLMPSSKS